MIDVRGVFYSYNSNAPYVLNGVDFKISKGEYVSVVGDNGSGKSTLIKLVLGLMKPIRGTVITNARHMGYVPQQRAGTELGFPLTVFEMLNSYRRIVHVKDKSVIKHVLGLVGLMGCENQLVRNLSGGQYQKALIARALLGKPDLLILDEPSTGIDTRSGADIYKILRRINSEEKMTVISVEHNLSAAISNSTLIYHLSGGIGHICSPGKYANEYLNLNKTDGGK